MTGRSFIGSTWKHLLCLLLVACAALVCLRRHERAGQYFETVQLGAQQREMLRVTPAHRKGIAARLLAAQPISTVDVARLARSLSGMGFDVSALLPSDPAKSNPASEPQWLTSGMAHLSVVLGPPSESLTAAWLAATPPGDALLLFLDFALAPPGRDHPTLQAGDPAVEPPQTPAQVRRTVMVVSPAGRHDQEIRTWACLQRIAANGALLIGAAPGAESSANWIPILRASIEIALRDRGLMPTPIGHPRTPLYDHWGNLWRLALSLLLLLILSSIFRQRRVLNKYLVFSVGTLSALALSLTLSRVAFFFLPPSPLVADWARWTGVSREELDDVLWLERYAGDRLGSLGESLAYVRLARSRKDAFGSGFEAYRKYVLSPVLETGRPTLSWRMPLLIELQQGARHSSDVMVIARNVSRRLRESVAVRGDSKPARHDLREIWESGHVNQAELALLYLAALRSVGVPSRMSAEHRVEIASAGRWHPAPLGQLHNQVILARR